MKEIKKEALIISSVLFTMTAPILLVSIYIISNDNLFITTFVGLVFLTIITILILEIMEEIK